MHDSLEPYVHVLRLPSHYIPTIPEWYMYTCTVPWILWFYDSWAGCDIKSVLFVDILEAFVSLATNDFYAKGALALGHSIRKTHTSRRLALLVTNSISPEMRWGPEVNYNHELSVYVFLLIWQFLCNLPWLLLFAMTSVCLFPLKGSMALVLHSWVAGIVFR